MGVIKSALEIAMENSKGIEANKELLQQNTLRDEGKSWSRRSSMTRPSISRQR
jgi:hypothetical protein